MIFLAKLKLNMAYALILKLAACFNSIVQCVPYDYEQVSRGILQIPIYPDIRVQSDAEFPRSLHSVGKDTVNYGIAGINGIHIF